MCPAYVCAIEIIHHTSLAMVGTAQAGSSFTNNRYNSHMIHIPLSCALGIICVLSASVTTSSIVQLVHRRIFLWELNLFLSLNQAEVVRRLTRDT